MRRYSNVFYVAALLGLLTVGCSSAALEPEGADARSAPQNGKADALDAPVLSEHYALTINSWMSIGDGPDDDMPEEWTAQFRGLVSTSTVDGDTMLLVRPCAVTLPAVDDREVVMPEEVIQRGVPAYLRADINLEGDRPTLTTDLGAMMAGVNLGSPVTEELPTDEDDERLVDVDEDNRPAMTITIDGYRVYVGLRVKMNLDGEFQTDGRITGQSGLRVDLGIYGDSVPFVNVKNHLDRALGKLDLHDERHTFQLTPLVDNGDSCGNIPDAAFLAQDETTQEGEESETSGE